MRIAVGGRALVGSGFPGISPTCRKPFRREKPIVTVRGMVKNGKVPLENPDALAEGTEVEVRPLKKRKRSANQRKPKTKVRRKSLAERLANVIGKAPGLPPDAAVNHDHYLYGLSWPWPVPTKAVMPRPSSGASKKSP
jgi:hypothetical protein